MFTLTIVLAVVVATAFALLGGARLVGAPRMTESREHLGIASGLWKIIGGLEVIGAIGVVVGLHEDLPVVGVLAAVGLVAMTIGATYYHQKAGDSIPAWLPAVALGSIVVFYSIARIGSA